MTTINTDELARYFTSIAQQRRSTAAKDFAGAAAEEEPPPTELNTINSAGGFLVVFPDKLTVKYTSVDLHGHDVGAVQANRAAPTNRLVYYFEIFVKDAGVKGQISIGFTGENFLLRRRPGWDANSCGYQGDDGLLYRGQAKGDTFGPSYTLGDTVGGGINYATQEFFFTKNGTIVGTVNKDIEGPLFPTVAVHSQNEEVYVNFGQKPFAFDLKEYEAQERMKQDMAYAEISLPPNISYGLVRSYLLHYGYEDTLSSLEQASMTCDPPVSVGQENGFCEQQITYALNHRMILRQLIRKGQIDATFAKLHDWYPQIVQDDRSAICFLLHCQKFIELIQGEALEEAVRYGRNELVKFSGLVGFKDLLQDCVALLAYEQPQKSSVGYLLEDSQRELVADAVNAVVLSTNPNLKDSRACLHSYLERLLRQLSACSLERRSLNGNQGEVFHLQRVLSSGKRTKC